MANVLHLAQPAVAALYVMAAVSLGSLQLLFGPVESSGRSVFIAAGWIALAVGVYRGRAWVLTLSAAAFPAAVLLTLGASAANLAAEPSTVLLILLLMAQAPLQFVVLLLDTEATPLGSPLGWAAYAAHVALLAGPLVQRLIRPARTTSRPSAPPTNAATASGTRALAAERSAKLELPTPTLAYYERNPFNVLGLIPSAKTREIVRRGGELCSMVAQGDDPHTATGFVHVALGAGGIDEESVKSAVAQTQQTPDRVRHALVWFWLEDAPDTLRDALREGRLDDAIGEWKQQLEQGEPDARARSLHNLAVATHARALKTETDADPDAIASRSGWREALEYWRLALESADVWAHIHAMVKHSSDPRVRGTFADELRPWLAGAVLDVHMRLARAAAAQGWYDYAGAHVALVRACGFGEDVVQHALGDFLDDRAEEVRAAMAALLDRPRPTRSADAEKRLAPIQRARAVCTAVGGIEWVRETIGAETVAVVAKLRAEAVDAFKKFWQVNASTMKENNALIDEWNHFMNIANYQPFRRAAALAGLRDVYERFRARSSAVREIESAFRTLRTDIERVQLLLRVLEKASAHGPDDATAKVRVEFEDNRKYLKEAAEASASARDHYQRNLAGQSNNLGS